MRNRTYKKLLYILKNTPGGQMSSTLALRSRLSETTVRKYMKFGVENGMVKKDGVYWIPTDEWMKNFQPSGGTEA